MTENILALDFDGVICDSARECLFTAYACYGPVAGFSPASNLEEISPSVQGPFFRMRPFVRDGKDYIVTAICKPQQMAGMDKTTTLDLGDTSKGLKNSSGKLAGRNCPTGPCRLHSSQTVAPAPGASLRRSYPLLPCPGTRGPAHHVHGDEKVRRRVGEAGRVPPRAPVLREACTRIGPRPSASRTSTCDTGSSRTPPPAAGA